DRGLALGKAEELTDRVERDLGIVRAGLHAEVAAALLLDELVAVEARQIDERIGTARGEADTVDAVAREQTRPETERQREARGIEAERFARVLERRCAVGGRRGAGRGCVTVTVR